MQAIIDAGGKIQDIIIEHPVYGRISAPLEIYSRNDIVKFKEKCRAVMLCRSAILPLVYITTPYWLILMKF